MPGSDEDAAEEQLTKRGLARRDVRLWDDEAFLRRMRRFAAERCISLAQLCREAGLSRDYLHKSAGAAGRSIEALLRLAHGLGITLPELLGYYQPRPSLDRSPKQRLHNKS
jgi:DNA-binding phage protein